MNRSLIYQILSALLLLGFVGCSDDAQPDYPDKQKITITLDGETIELFSGEFYEESGEANATFGDLIYDEIRGYVKLTLEHSNTKMDEFNFTFYPGIEYLDLKYSEDAYFNRNGASDQNIKQNIETKAQTLLFRLSVDGGSEEYYSSIDMSEADWIDKFGTTSKADVDESYLKLTNVHSNGVEEYVDGQKKSYPNERFEGNLNLAFTDPNGSKHNATVDFDIQGEDVIKGGESYSNTTSSGGGSVDCEAGYSGPEFNIQIDSQCKAAFAYLCAGNEEGAKVACGLYKQWDDPDNPIPSCTYCIGL